jgi:serine phosphatase RsbU (regulator of sigma subunit)
VESARQRRVAWSRDDRLTAVIAAVLFALLYLASLHSYLLFHELAEIVFITVCFSVLVMAWSLRPFLEDDFMVFLGAGLFFVAALHVVHLVDYPGLGLLSGSPDPPTQVWLGARFLLAAVLIASTFFIGRRLRPGIVVACGTAYATLVLASVYWWHVAPVTFVAGSGLTTFKKAAEYVICVLFGLAIVMLWRRRDRMPFQTWRLLRAALIATIAAELWFTLYQSPSTWPNLIGHLLLVLSALLLFRAVVDDGLARPHAAAMANLRAAELMHRRLERALVPSVPLERQELEVIVRYRASERHLELSGDFIDVLDQGEAGVAVICGDVSGHGPNAAAMGAMLRASWQALTDSGAAPATLVASLRAVLERERRNPLTFATLCLAWIDPRGNEVTILSLGHPAPLLLSADGGAEPLPATPMPPLGTVDWPTEEPLRLTLPDGWRLFFYTDGLIEGRVAPGSPERFGERRLVAAVRDHLDTASSVGGQDLDRLLDAVEAMNGAPFADDVTIMFFSKVAAGARGHGSPTPTKVGPLESGADPER